MGALIVSLGGGGGASSDECTATANDILKGTRTINRNSDDEIVEGALELTGNAEDKYVVKDRTYYNVDAHEKRTGSLELTGNAQVAHVPKGETFYTTDTQTKLTGTATSKAAETYYVTTSDQTIAAGQYLNGAQKISKITASGLTGGNILSGATITIHNGKSNVWSVAGTIPKLAGGTYTPSTSAQKIYCSGKYMTGDIIFNGIPSGYVNVNGNADLFNNGSFGTIAGGAKPVSVVPTSNSDYCYQYQGVVSNRMRWFRNSSSFSARSNSQQSIVFKKKIPFQYELSLI